MLSHILSTASRSARARRAVENFPPTRRIVNRFVPGETIGAALTVLSDLTARDFLVTLDVLGEDVTDVADAGRTRDTYLSLLAALDDGGWSQRAEVSVKLSALGQSLPKSGDTIALDNARQICAAAAEAGTTVTLDMEDHTTVDSSLSIGAALRADYPTIGTVLQSNLRRTEADIAALASSAARVRLVKGAYKEPPSVAFQSKDEVDAAFVRGMGALMRSSCYPMIATHDVRMIRTAVEIAKACKRTPQDWELQMLYGIRTNTQRQLRQDGYRMRVYVPFGDDWFGYFMRRLAERPANVAFLLRALKTDRVSPGYPVSPTSAATP